MKHISTSFVIGKTYHADQVVVLSFSEWIYLLVICFPALQIPVTEITVLANVYYNFVQHH